MTTLVLASCASMSAQVICEGVVDPPGRKSAWNMLGSPELLKLPSEPSPPQHDATISMFVGSSSNVPLFPLGALVSTLAWKSSHPLLDTSTNPPSPDWRPPRALMAP